MTVEITRDVIAERLGHVTYDRFLFYLMGPYKSFNLNYVLSEKERQEIDVEDLPGRSGNYFRAKKRSTRRRHCYDGYRSTSCETRSKRISRS